jgi:Zn-finger nucleic acid-binding protein
MPIKPSSSEDEYFKREEVRTLKKLCEQAASGLEEQERKRLKELHWMRCPKCGMELAEVDFRGVTVDSCFSCGGAFLDKGEVEKALAYKEPGWLGKAFLNMLGADRSSDDRDDS